MSLKELKAKIRWAWEEAYCKGNVNALEEVLDPDLVIHVPPFPDLKGLETEKQNAAAMNKAFSNIKFDWEDMVGEGNIIVCRFTMHMQHTGVINWLPVPPTGKEMTHKVCDVHHLKNDKIVEIFVYNEFLGFFQQAGIIPPMGQK